MVPGLRLGINVHRVFDNPQCPNGTGRVPRTHLGAVSRIFVRGEH